MARDLALDFAKGLLVAVMIVYHWMNFTWGPIGRINDYFRFLTPAFIFLVGWTIATYYPEKYGVENPRLFRRLTIRGLQLLGFFVGVNLITHAARDWHGNAFRSEWGSLGGDLFGIFVSGNRELMSFHVLWPISVLLLLAGQGLRLASPHRWAALWLIAGAFLLSQILPLPPTRNANLLSFGFLGQLAGRYRGISSASLPRTFLLLLVAFTIYFAAVWWLGSQYFVQLIATPLHVALFHSLGRAFVGHSGIATLLAWVGRSSLTGYITHVAGLQVLVQFFRPRHIDPLIAGLILIIVSSGTVLTIYAVTWLQQAFKRRAHPALS